MDAADDLRLGQRQQVIIALEVAGPVGKALAAIAGLVQLVLLDHGAHGTVEDDDALGEKLFEGLAHAEVPAGLEK